MGNNSDARRRKNFWWQWGRYTPGLYAAIAPLERVLVNPLYATHLCFAFLPTECVFANKLNVIPFPSSRTAATDLPARAHRLDAGSVRAAHGLLLDAFATGSRVPGEVEGVVLDMERLGALEDGPAAHAALDRLPQLYERWIEAQQHRLEDLSERRREVAQGLIAEAGAAAGRIRDGVARLDDLHLLDAFRTMNRAIAAALRRRRTDDAPAWYPFQLAFILLNLPGLVEPTHNDRRTVDLLFFPTSARRSDSLRLTAGQALNPSPGAPFVMTETGARDLAWTTGHR